MKANLLRGKAQPVLTEIKSFGYMRPGVFFFLCFKKEFYPCFWRDLVGASFINWFRKESKTFVVDAAMGSPLEYISSKFISALLTLFNSLFLEQEDDPRVRQASFGKTLRFPDRFYWKHGYKPKDRHLPLPSPLVVLKSCKPAYNIKQNKLKELYKMTLFLWTRMIIAVIQRT